jgi:ABC-type Mn2+/Zn2+ transport system permease subunit
MSWIVEFVGSFELFGAQWVAGCLAALLLGLVGVLVVARRQVFLGAAAAQSSTLGCALALALSDSVTVTDLFAVGFAVAAALGVAAARPERSAVVFLAAAGLSILVVSKSPHGTEQVHRIVASASLLGSKWSDAGWLALLLAAAAALAVRFRRPLVLIAMDPTFARAAGLPVTLVERIVAAFTGIAIGLVLCSAGLLFSFGTLVLPALIARQGARQALALFWLAPAIAFGSALASFVVANHLDLPPGQVTIVLLCAELGVAAAWARLRPARVTAA